MPFLQRATSSPTAAHREVGIYVMYSVLETVIEGIKQQTSSLFTIFTELIKDPESAQVRITTVQALGVLAQYIETEDKQDIVSGTCDVTVKFTDRKPPENIPSTRTADSRGS